MSDTNQKPTLCIDFDGVIHDYRYGWDGGSIRGDVTPGFFEWAIQASKLFTLAVYSTRSKDAEQVSKMTNWLSHQAYKAMPPGKVMYGDCDDAGQLFGLTAKCRRMWFSYAESTSDPAFIDDRMEFYLVAEKPVAFLTIDDRAIQFNGSWSDAMIGPEQIKAYKPWNDELMRFTKEQSNA